MLNILCIETSTKSCSVALKYNNQVFVTERNEPNIHASVLTLFINEVLLLAKTTFEKIDAVAVSIGPGSYTGLRIGLSTAKGICFALNKPLITIPTLDAMASGFKNKHSLENSDFLLCPMIDARRMEVYCALYSSSLNCIENMSAKVIDAQSFYSELNNFEIYFFGDGAEKCSDIIISDNALINSTFINSAADMIPLAEEKFLIKDFADIAYSEPYYLKEFAINNLRTN